MCHEVCFCCGPSLAGVVNGIAIFDLICSTISVTFETVTAGTLLGLLVPITQNKSSCLVTNNCTWLYEYVEDDVLFDFDTYAVTALIIFVFFGFMVEAYLFSTLRHGIHEKIYKYCRKWLNLRTVLLVLTSVGSVVKYMRNIYFVPIDGLLDILKIYRIVSLLIVWSFMTELAHTVGIIYVKPPKRVKRGSL